MKFYFFDTSALVKRYHSESGTEVVDRIFSEEDRAIAISSISITEIISALNRKKEDKTITEEDLESVLSEFFQDVIKEFLVFEVDEESIKNSIELVLNKNLRTLDSLQLSIALGIKGLDVIFVCSDKKLNAAAKELGLEIKNPEE